MHCILHLKTASGELFYLFLPCGCRPYLPLVATLRRLEIIRLLTQATLSSVSGAVVLFAEPVWSPGIQLLHLRDSRVHGCSVCELWRHCFFITPLTHHVLKYVPPFRSCLHSDFGMLELCVSAASVRSCLTSHAVSCVCQLSSFVSAHAHCIMPRA